MVDPDVYTPVDAAQRWTLGYLGTYSSDRQPTVDRLLIEPARRLAEHDFVVAGPQYPTTAAWPDNVDHIDHVPPTEHASFYGAQRFTLNVTRVDMIRSGYSPSVRLFEAAACAVPVISDRWPGIEDYFVEDREMLFADTTADVVRLLAEIDDEQRQRIGLAARTRVLAAHTADHRAEELERHVSAAQARPRD
jgi:spore maturation protein CgeB